MKPLHEQTDDPFSLRVKQAVQALPDAPQAWHERASKLFVAPAGWETRAVTALAQWVKATLTFDSWSAPALAQGMRSLRSRTRHLLYSAEGRDVDLRITAAAERFDLTGQVLGPDESGQVELVPEGGGVDNTLRGSLDDLGEFRIQAVPAGRYVLTLHLGQHPIVVEALEVGMAST